MAIIASLNGRTLTIKKEGRDFVVDDEALHGSSATGRGHTMHSAIGNWLVAHQTRLGLQFKVDDSAKPSEENRRKRELAKR